MKLWRPFIFPFILIASLASLLAGCNGQPLTTAAQSLQDNARWQGRWVWVQGRVQDTYPVMGSPVWNYTLIRDNKTLTIVHQSPDPLPKVGDIVRVRGIVLSPLPRPSDTSPPRVAGYDLVILRREKS